MQSKGEPPELEEVNDEYEIPQDSWDILDKAKPIEEPTSSNPAFITEGPPPEDKKEMKQTSPSPPSDTSTTCEEIPLITAKNETSDSQDGLFSRSTAQQNSPPHSSLIMGASPSPSADRHSSRSVGFKPLIEVVSSTSQQNDSQERSQPSTNQSYGPPQSSPTTISESTCSSTKKSACPFHGESSRKPAWSTVSDKASAAPESTELESGGQWAISTSSTKLEPPLKTKPESTLEGGGLLIEEIDNDNDDFSVGRLPLTAYERACIAQTDAALQRIKDRPISELSEEERVWQLAASAGSTEGGAEGAELDEETKARLRERLSKHGLIDKTSLKF